jgi:phage shock protein C
MRRLYRSRKSKVIAGVCGGIAEYFNVDPVLIRLISVLFLFAGGAAFIAYIIGMIIIPIEPWAGFKEGEGALTQGAVGTEHAESSGPKGSLIVGVIMIVFGVHFLLRRIPFFFPYYWRFWDMGWHFFWPSVLIGIGLLVIFRGARQ